MADTIELEKEDEEVEGKVIECGCDEVSILSIIYPLGSFIVSSARLFFVCLVLILIPFRYLLTLSLVSLHIQEHTKKNRGKRKQKYIRPR